MKRTVSIFLLVWVILIITIFPVSAEPIEGICGANLTWTLEDGTLTISGTGPMEYYHPQPWYDYRDQIHTLIISEGVTSISYSAFLGLSNLSTVSMASTVTSIDGNAFSGCYSLTSVPLTNNITSIGAYAFFHCSGLTSVTIPPSITVISNSAFSSCYQLQTISIPDSVTTIDSNAFYNCNNLTSVTLPDSITSIGAAAFSGCSSLTSISLPQHLTSISGNLFSSCPNLRSITIPDSVTEIGGYAFNSCTNLQEIQIGAGVSSIAESAFWKCPSLSHFSVSSDNPYFTTDQGIIYNKSKTTLIRAPQGFSGSYSVLPGTQAIEQYAMYECSGITSLTIPGSVISVEEYGCCGLSGLQSLTLSHGLTSLNTYAFSRCSNLQNLTLPATITYIGQQAFSGCQNIKEITFLGMAPEIESRSFSSVTATVYYPASKPGWKDSQHLYGGILTWVASDSSCDENHTPQSVPGKTPTCTEDGLSEGAVCQKCGEVITQQTTLSATGHSFGSWVEIIAATESSEGLAKRTCAVCQYAEETAIPKLSTYVPTTTAPTEPIISQPETTLEEATEAEIIVSTVPDITGAPSPTVESTEPEINSPHNSAPSDSDSTGLIIVGGVVIVSVVCAGVFVLLKRKHLI